jgi:hypothetical protein
MRRVPLNNTIDLIDLNMITYCTNVHLSTDELIPYGVCV